MTCDNCHEAIRARDLAQEASNRDLEVRGETDNLQWRVMHWVKTRIGPDHAGLQEFGEFLPALDLSLIGCVVITGRNEGNGLNWH